MNEPIKQLNIRLPERTHREFKARCALDGLSLVGAIEQFVNAYVAGRVSADVIRPAASPVASPELAGPSAAPDQPRKEGRGGSLRGKAVSPDAIGLRNF